VIESASLERIWLDRPVILAIHDRQLTDHGGASGVRDEGLLESALARPRQHAAYGEPDLAELAALYAIAIAHNHPFIDGNKRTAFVALELFLAKNGAAFAATDTACVLMMLGMAAGEISDAEFVVWVRQNIAECQQG
jgi:death-on-curing protein